MPLYGQTDNTSKNRTARLKHGRVVTLDVGTKYCHLVPKNVQNCSLSAMFIFPNLIVITFSQNICILYFPQISGKALNF